MKVYPWNVIVWRCVTCKAEHREFPKTPCCEEPTDARK